MIFESDKAKLGVDDTSLKLWGYQQDLKIVPCTTRNLYELSFHGVDAPGGGQPIRGNLAGLIIQTPIGCYQSSLFKLLTQTTSIFCSKEGQTWGASGCRLIKDIERIQIVSGQDLLDTDTLTKDQPHTSRPRTLTSAFRTSTRSIFSFPKSGSMGSRERQELRKPVTRAGREFATDGIEIERPLPRKYLLLYCKQEMWCIPFKPDEFHVSYTPDIANHDEPFPYTYNLERIEIGNNANLKLDRDVKSINAYRIDWVPEDRIAGLPMWPDTRTALIFKPSIARGKLRKVNSAHVCSLKAFTAVRAQIPMAT
ncbi:hypothetical protein DFH27DRAFT_579282 [Peziza echinospora]|nr:hypothetical protein DFH27DRAFT_579282 [Peziza echinospora]